MQINGTSFKKYMITSACRAPPCQACRDGAKHSKRTIQNTDSGIHSTLNMKPPMLWRISLFRHNIVDTRLNSRLYEQKNLKSLCIPLFSGPLMKTQSFTCKADRAQVSNDTKEPL